MQGKLRNEPLSFDITTECACCGVPIHITMAHDLSYTLGEPDSKPMFYVPMVDLTKLKAPSIVDAF